MTVLGPLFKFNQTELVCSVNMRQQTLSLKTFFFNKIMKSTSTVKRCHENSFCINLISKKIYSDQ